MPWWTSTARHQRASTARWWRRDFSTKSGNWPKLESKTGRLSVFREPETCSVGNRGESSYPVCAAAARGSLVVWGENLRLHSRDPGAFVKHRVNPSLGNQ